MSECNMAKQVDIFLHWHNQENAFGFVRAYGTETLSVNIVSHKIYNNIFTIQWLREKIIDDEVIPQRESKGVRFRYKTVEVKPKQELFLRVNECCINGKLFLFPSNKTL